MCAPMKRAITSTNQQWILKQIHVEWKMTHQDLVDFVHEWACVPIHMDVFLGESDGWVRVHGAVDYVVVKRMLFPSLSVLCVCHDADDEPSLPLFRCFQDHTVPWCVPPQ